MFIDPSGNLRKVWHNIRCLSWVEVREAAEDVQSIEALVGIASGDTMKLHMVSDREGYLESLR
jgi:hypothetical protein